jgi:hypothetical protein
MENFMMIKNLNLKALSIIAVWGLVYSSQALAEEINFDNGYSSFEKCKEVNKKVKGYMEVNKLFNSSHNNQIAAKPEVASKFQSPYSRNVDGLGIKIQNSGTWFNDIFTRVSLGEIPEFKRKKVACLAGSFKMTKLSSGGNDTMALFLHSSPIQKPNANSVIIDDGSMEKDPAYNYSSDSSQNFIEVNKARRHASSLIVPVQYSSKYNSMPRDAIFYVRNDYGGNQISPYGDKGTNLVDKINGQKEIALEFSMIFQDDHLVNEILIEAVVVDYK